MKHHLRYVPRKLDGSVRSAFAPLMASVALVTLAGEVVLAQDVLLTIDGSANFEGLRDHESMGDLDGDGVMDFVVGVASKGKARVYSGSTGAMLIEVVGVPSTGFGVEVANAGDFDGDGVCDFAVGATGDDTAGLDRGAVYVFSGSDGVQIAAMYGQFFEEGLGRRIAGLGDLNGDGFADIGVAPYMHNRVRIYGGPDGAQIRFHALGGGTTRPSVAGVGDVNGDGVPDYVIGWPQDSTGGGLTGTAALFSGRNGALLRQVHGITPTQAGEWAITGSHLGASVAGVGDLDGDGVPDFAAGAPGTVDIFFFATQAFVRAYSGVDAQVLHHWDGYPHTAPSIGGGMFGMSVAGGGDLNGDGVPDLLVGAPFDASTRGSVSAFSGRTGGRLWRVKGSESSARLYYCSIVGDLDGDGIDDFATGETGFDSTFTGGGRITVYAGAPGELERHCLADPLHSQRALRLWSYGPISIGNDFLRLHSTNATPGGLCFFFYGPLSPPAPLHGGLLCTGPPAYWLPPLSAGPTGFVEVALDFTQPPLSDGPGAIHPGSTWSFQLYCRDPSPTGHLPRISDGLSILFPP